MAAAKAMKVMKAMKASKKPVKAVKWISEDLFYAGKVKKKKTVSKLVAASKAAKKSKKPSRQAAVENDLVMPEWYAKRAQELKAMSKDALQKLLSSLGLKGGIKRDMVVKLMAHEAWTRQQAEERKARVEDILREKKRELEGLSGEELDDLCAEKGLKLLGLKLGADKQERVERLLANFEDEGGVAAALEVQDVESRREELCSLETADLLQMCNKAGIDPFVKEVLVERILRHELFGKGESSLIPVLMND